MTKKMQEEHDFYIHEKYKDLDKEVGELKEYIRDLEKDYDYLKKKYEDQTYFFRNLLGLPTKDIEKSLPF